MIEIFLKFVGNFFIYCRILKYFFFKEVLYVYFYMVFGFFFYVFFLEICEKKWKVFMVNYVIKNLWVKMKEKFNSG